MLDEYLKDKEKKSVKFFIKTRGEIIFSDVSLKKYHAIFIKTFNMIMN